MLACIGSHTQTTGCSPWRAARSSGGSLSSTRPAPMRVISVSRPELHSDRVVDAGEERDVCAVGGTGTLADPEHVRRAVVPVAGQRVTAGQPLLVVQQQALMARPDVHLVQVSLGLEVDAAGGHEPQSALDLPGDRLVAAALRR